MDTIKAEKVYAAKVLDALSTAPSKIPDAPIDEDKTHNAAGCMTAFFCGRLAVTGSQPEVVERTTIKWSNGIVNIPKCSEGSPVDESAPTFIERFEQHSGDKPSTYLMAAWPPNDTECHIWAIPGKIVHNAMPHFAVGKTLDKRSVEILPSKNVFERCGGSTDLSPYYRSIRWSEAEKTKLIEALKIDKVARRRNRGESEEQPYGHRER